MSNQDTKFRIIKLLEKSSNCFETAFQSIEVYLRALEAVPFEIRSIPEHLITDYGDGLLNKKEAFKSIYNYLEKVPD